MAAELNGCLVIPFTAGDGSGVISGTANPEGETVYITRAILEITTASTGASTLDIGVGASDTSNDGLFDGYSGATIVVTDNIKEVTGNAKAGQKWASNTYVNIAEASGDVTGIVGNLHIQYVRLPA